MENFLQRNIVMSDSKRCIWTLGYGNRSLRDILVLMHHYSLNTLVDVRSYPFSSYNPEFNIEYLRDKLIPSGIIYHWAGRQLGGMRKAKGDTPNVALDKTMSGFADHMLTDSFQRGVSQLKILAKQQSVAILCAEKVFNGCHRKLVADYLHLMEGFKVIHIQDTENVVVHRVTSSARVELNAIIYDNACQQRFNFH